jgi:predicted enzyme related to lactoylglutathione lyase
MSYLHGKFVWFEHSSNDLPKARQFYDALFNGHTEAMPMGKERYHMIQNGNDGIGGYRASPAGAPSYWLAYLSVADVDASYAAALAAGAKSVTPPTDHGPVGRGAVIKDPTGATFSLWKSTQDDRPDATKTPSGDWYWNELWTPDDVKALAFYERVFGYTHDSMDMGPQGTYYLLKKDGIMRAGLMRSVEPNAPPMWLPYVAVDDCDASVAKAKSLGAKLVHGPMDIAGVGRFAILIDPLGAAIAVMRGTPQQT